MRSPLDTFAGLLDRTVQEIAALTTDARNFDTIRVAALADIWDNNTFPLFRAATAPWLLRSRRARTGLLWMADLGPDRRALLVDLDPALDRFLPTAGERRFHRDYQNRVYPRILPVTEGTADYDLAAADITAITVRPARSGLRAEVTVAAPRRFTPSVENPSPAILRLTFTGVTDLLFDAADRRGVRIEPGLAVSLGQHGTLRATAAEVWPQDSYWHESEAGRAADAVTPYERPAGRPPTSSLTVPQENAAVGLTLLMQEIRVAGYHPMLASAIPLPELCRRVEGAGSAILAAAAKGGNAFADLAQRWQPARRKRVPFPIPEGPSVIRYVRYEPARVVMVAAIPVPAAPWRLASEELPHPAAFRISILNGDLQVRHAPAAP